MDWIMTWVRNLAFYYIFMNVILTFLPDNPQRKYIRFFLGMLLILVLLRPFLQLGEFDEKLSDQVLENVFAGEYQDMLGQKMDKAGESLKEACRLQMEQQIEQLMTGWGYELKTCEIGFFPGEELELKEIRIKVKEKEKGEKSIQEQSDFLKKELEGVYNLPAGNIMITIQG